MEHQYSTSKVTVEYFDPHDVYKLLAPGLVPLLPLRNLRWKSHTGTPRSIDTLHVDLVPAGGAVAPGAPSVLSPVASPQSKQAFESNNPTSIDSFPTQALGGRPITSEAIDPHATASVVGRERRHQIPGLRRTPYLKLLLVRCDDNDSYKSHVRTEIRDWLKQNTPPQSSKRASNAENHDAFEWLIVHVVIPNTTAATQPRLTGKGDSADAKVASRWRGSTTTIFEKMMADFNTTKGPTDRVAQIRIGINDVPYDILPRVIPAVPTGYTETAQDVENAWADLIAKMKVWILSSFDMRVSQYEEDIKEKDAQRSLPGWNFCTFFILKEGLARGFESVGLVEDALVGYDELSVGLDSIIHNHAGSSAGGTLLRYTDELRRLVLDAAATSEAPLNDHDSQQPPDSSAGDQGSSSSRTGGKFDRAHAVPDSFDLDIPISAAKKPYRELILANNVSVFDFRCYIFARQIALLFRLGNATATREELLAKTREQQESLLHGVAPRMPALTGSTTSSETENLSTLAEVCRRTLEFIPAVSHVLRQDLIAALVDAETVERPPEDSKTSALSPSLSESIENVVSSFAFSVAQQVLAQTSTKALPIPESGVAVGQGNGEPTTSIPEPTSIILPARSSSLHGPMSLDSGSSSNVPEPDASHSKFLKAGLEELAARRAELFNLSRNILEECGKKRGWSDGWDSVPVVGESDNAEMEYVDLDADEASHMNIDSREESGSSTPFYSLAGLANRLLWTALHRKDDFYRLYETLTLKALRHYTVASHFNSVKACMIDLAVLKYHLGNHAEAAAFFVDAIPFFAERGWSLLELSLLVMYSRCLEELGQTEDYVKVALKLLSKAAMAEYDRIHQSRASKRHLVERRSDKITADGQTPPNQNSRYPPAMATRGLLSSLTAAMEKLKHEVSVPLLDFFFDVGVDGGPIYHEEKDSFSLNLTLRSLFMDDLDINSVVMRISCPETGGLRSITLTSSAVFRLRPGRNTIQLDTAQIPLDGTYAVQSIYFRHGSLTFQYDQKPSSSRFQGSNTSLRSDLIGNSKVLLIHRAGSVDVKLSAAKEIQLDKNNSLEVELTSGWNKMKTCNLRIRAATGGLRLLTSDGVLATDQGASTNTTLGPPEGGVFRLGALDEQCRLIIRIPYTVELEVPEVSVRVEVSFTTEGDDGTTFEFAKTPSVGVTLALGVNVQDVFKHDHLLSRFTVTTATASPLRLFSTELMDSDFFTAHFNGTSSKIIDSTPSTSHSREHFTIYPDQPASLLYKLTRKPGSAVNGPTTGRTLYLKIIYAVLQDEIESRIETSLMDGFSADDPASRSLWAYARLMVRTVVSFVKSVLFTECDIEHAVAVGWISTSFLAAVPWQKHFALLVHTDNQNDVPAKLESFIIRWQKEHQKLSILPEENPGDRKSCILIPVDVPSITIVHTANIMLRAPTEAWLSKPRKRSFHTLSTWEVNHLVPATLHLKWTRAWDTGSPDQDTQTVPSTEAIEFSYEVTAPQDTWLIGGRRKGHFVIPGLQDKASVEDEARYAMGIRSTPDTEADIPLLLVPLREGWISLPMVDIREVRNVETANAIKSDYYEARCQGVPGDLNKRVNFETDFQNLGETVYVTSNRSTVTLSLDASGQGGGPLVLETK